MDFESLRVFVEVVRRGSFAAVARDRNVDPSSISRSIAALEEELGIRLFQRTTRQLGLTESGEVYFNRIESLVDELEAARDATLAMHVKPSGTLRLTATVTFGNHCLLPLLPEFRSRYPGLKLELLLTDAPLDLVSERVDLAIRLSSQLDGSFVGSKLFDTRYRVCVSPDYLARGEPLREPHDIATRSCILSTLPEFRSRWQFRSPSGETHSVAVDGDLIISNAAARRTCALAGMGPALLVDWLVGDDLAQGRLIDPFPDYIVSATEFDMAAWLVYPSRTHLSTKVRVMIDFLKNRLGR